MESLSPSISLVDLSAFPTLREVWRIELDGTTGQEPEQVAFSADSDHVAVALQDSQQVAFFQVSALANNAAPTAADLKIVTLPNNSLGAEPWPDGTIGFQAIRRRASSLIRRNWSAALRPSSEGWALPVRASWRRPATRTV